MGRINNYLAFALLVAVTSGCEKETLDLPEENVLNSKNLTFTEFLNSGIDVENYYNSYAEKEQQNRDNYKSHSNFAGADEAYFEDYCSNLPLEDFETANIDQGSGSQFLGPLSEDKSNTTRILASDMESGLLITTDATRPILAIFGDGLRGGSTKLIVGNTDQALVLQFSKDDVLSVGMDISSFPYPDVENTQEVSIQVLYATGETHSETITASISGTFWGITGTESIKKITIASTNADAWVGVDNIAFGTCAFPDADADGCIDSEDPNDSSNMESTINIGGCISNVANRATSVCGVTLSDLIDNLESAHYRNKGAFVSAFAHAAGQWLAEGLITAGEKDLLVSCAANAVI